MNVAGLDAAVELLPAQGSVDDAVGVQVSLEQGRHEPIRPLDAEGAAEGFGGSHQWVLDRAAKTARLIGPPLDLDLLAHPCLAPVATAFNRWAGRETFHAASFALAGRGYGVVGARTAGKSTLMAGLAARGLTVVSDDIVVTDGADIFAGPRCIDLRAPLPGLPLAAVSARLGTRWRVSLPAAPSRLPLAGWIFLAWGDGISLQRCPASQVLGWLARWRGRQGLASDPTVLLDLATRPAWVLTRPAEWASYDESLERLLRGVLADTVAGAR